MKYSLWSRKSEIIRSKRIFVATTISFVVMCIGCSRAMFSAYMPDDYLLQMINMPLSFYMQQGRFVQAAITWVFNNLDINIVSSSPIFLPLFIFFSSLSASLIIDSICGDDTPLILYLLMPSIVVSHPVFSMMAVYHLASVCFALCMWCVAAFVVINERGGINKSEWWKTCLLVIIICGNYQPAIVIVGSYFIFHLINNYKYNELSGSIKKLIPFLLGVFLYAILFKITKTSLGENHWDTRASMVTDYHARLHEIWHLLPSFFYKNWWVIPWQYSLLLTIIMVVFFLSSAISRGISVSIYIPAFIVCIFAAIAPIAAIEKWDISPRAMFSVSFSYAIMIASVSDNNLLVRTKIALTTALIILSMMVSNSYLQKSEDDNIRDGWIFDQVSRDLSVMGVNNEVVDVINITGRFKISEWAVRPLIYKRTGMDFNINANMTSSSDVCSDKNAWPSKKYIIKGPGKVSVCL